MSVAALRLWAAIYGKAIALWHGDTIWHSFCGTTKKTAPDNCCDTMWPSMDPVGSLPFHAWPVLPFGRHNKTTAPELTLCCIIANIPGPCLWLDQTDEDAKDESESRIQKLFESCEPVKKLFPRNKNKQRNTTVHFSNGMTLWLLGAHNKTNLQRRSIRWLFGDETWRWPVGHMAEAEARTTAFGWLGKCVFMSQGSEDNDETHKKFETTDMREWHYKCPGGEEFVSYSWENVEWDAVLNDAATTA